mmetsp:Transcript_18773/g.34613  ORF Transcript_18773/g.34613 Transcript_18773/m.34613 type:complete len:104 (-) Transcript_18773:980-1291(-)
MNNSPSARTASNTEVVASASTISWVRTSISNGRRQYKRAKDTNARDLQLKDGMKGLCVSTPTCFRDNAYVKDGAGFDQYGKFRESTKAEDLPSHESSSQAWSL